MRVLCADLLTHPPSYSSHYSHTHTPRPSHTPTLPHYSHTPPNVSHSHRYGHFVLFSILTFLLDAFYENWFPSISGNCAPTDTNCSIEQDPYPWALGKGRFPRNPTPRFLAPAPCPRSSLCNVVLLPPAPPTSTSTLPPLTPHLTNSPLLTPTHPIHPHSPHFLCPFRSPLFHSPFTHTPPTHLPRISPTVRAMIEGLIMSTAGGIIPGQWLALLPKRLLGKSPFLAKLQTVWMKYVHDVLS